MNVFVLKKYALKYLGIQAYETFSNASDDDDDDDGGGDIQREITKCYPTNGESG